VNCPTLSYIQGSPLCRAVVRVEQTEYAVIAHNSLATQLQEIQQEAIISVEGRITPHSRKVQDGKSRLLFTIEATALCLLHRPSNLML